MIGVICQVCRQRPACMHITEQSPPSAGQARGQIQSLDICHHCLGEKGLDDEDQPISIDLILNRDDPPSAIQQVAASDQRCPHCGLRLSQFVASKRFGCIHDYDLFGDTIVPLLDEFHGASHHVGRLPADDGGAETNDTFQRRLRYERELQDAIAGERYEEAARLRDKLKELG